MPLAASRVGYLSMRNSFRIRLGVAARALGVFAVCIAVAASAGDDATGSSDELIRTAVAKAKLADDLKALVDELVSLRIRNAHLTRETEEIRLKLHAAEKYRKLHDEWVALDVWARTLDELGAPGRQALRLRADAVWAEYNRGIRQEMANDSAYVEKLKALEEADRRMVEIGERLARPLRGAEPKPRSP
jgi:hypothetical protein